MRVRKASPAVSPSFLASSLETGALTLMLVAMSDFLLAWRKFWSSSFWFFSRTICLAVSISSRTSWMSFLPSGESFSISMGLEERVYLRVSCYRQVGRCKVSSVRLSESGEEERSQAGPSAALLHAAAAGREFQKKSGRACRSFAYQSSREKAQIPQNPKLETRFRLAPH